MIDNYIQNIIISTKKNILLSYNDLEYGLLHHI